MDPIGNMIVQIKNASGSGKKNLLVSCSKQNLAILKILQDLGYIADFKEIKNPHQKYPQAIKVNLIKSSKGEESIINLKRWSKPGRRFYVRAKNIPSRRNKREVIISTSQGLMTGKEAQKKGLGGEVILEVS